MDLDGRVVQGTGALNREVYIHSECYRARPDVGSVCHTHSPMVKVFATLGEPLKPVENIASVFAPETPVYNRIGLILTPQLGRELAETLGKHRAVLMRGHGSTVVGPDLKQATVMTIHLEETTKLTYRARCLGTPTPFTAEEAAAVSDLVLKKDSINRVWEYYQARLESGS